MENTRLVVGKGTSLTSSFGKDRVIYSTLGSRPEDQNGVEEFKAPFESFDVDLPERFWEMNVSEDGSEGLKG